MGGSDGMPAPNDDARLATLQRTVERLERELVLSRDLLHETAATRRTNAAELDRVRRELRAFKRHRSVRYALAASVAWERIAALARRVPPGVRRRIGRVRRRIAERARQPGLRASPAAEAALVATLRAALPAPALDRGPLVSIVILNRDGRNHLERCLAAVATTSYRDVEVIVVDNGSTDGSPELAESFELPFPIRVIRNATNRSYSEANGQGVAVATGQLICFLNNDVDPITDDWLGYMVETITSGQAVAVGARLIYPRHRGGARAGSKHPDLSLQHAGVDFDRSRAVPRARVIGAGGDAVAPWAARVQDRPALTAACLLVRLDAFYQVGGFSPAYDYGAEDADLCLKLRAAGGRLVYDGRAALWHHESATRAADQARYHARVSANRRAFIDIWGPRLFRDALLDALHGGDRFSSEPFHVAITVTGDDSATDLGDRSTSHALGDALETHGWRVSYLARADDGWYSPDRSIEAIIVLHESCDVRRLPRNLVTMAWIGDEPERWLDRVWFDEFDLVFASSDRAVGLVRERSAKVARILPIATNDAGAASADPYRPTAAAIRDGLIDWASATRYGLRIGVPSWEVIDRWGDYHFARGLQRSLERAGHPTRVHFLPDWASSAAARDDIAVHLFGLKEAPTHRGQVNILWQISHPDLATPELYERYDHVFVASDGFTARMAEQVAVPVTALHQATDPERFRPEPGGPRHELLFVASSRKVHRRIVDDLAGTAHELAIYGRDWTPELVDQRFVKGEVVANAELARYYSAADIVLNDHWDDMRIEGFISNRLYDALACGAFVISDVVHGIEAEFDGAVPTYRSRAELEPLIARYLEDPDERRRLADHGRAAVLERHTFDHRAQALCDVAEPLARARPAGIDGIAIAS
jgi:GT2 family glycosyltransferase/glycosyltransferase involved in cell wall biosynthesis